MLDIVALACGGQTPTQIQRAYPTLGLGQVHAALSYAREHPGEIDEQIEEDRRLAERIDRDRAALG